MIKELASCMVFMIHFCASAEIQMASQPWDSPEVKEEIARNVAYYPIAHKLIKSIPIHESGQSLVDLLVVDNPRIKPLSFFNPRYANTYEGFSKVRLGLYERLLKMLEYLPDNVGISYFEGFRPLHKQKEYFDNKFKEILAEVHDKECAYEETSKHVSPFIDNIPTHTTGAAFDMTLFIIHDDGTAQLLDMGKFDVIFGPNDQQETFSENTTELQRKNRLLLLEAATRAGIANYGFEWWHYSYGDKMWASVNHQKNALYGLAVPADDPILSIDKKAYLDSF